MNLTRLHWVALIIFVSGCAALGTMSLDSKFGKAEPSDRIVQSISPESVDYWTEVKPVVENRCIVCHGCFDAPCQLKMTSIEGIVRGASTEKVYDTGRIKETSPTRLYEDAQTVQEWRAKGFFPVLNEHDNSLQANREASVMYQLLQLKQENPLPDVKVLPEDITLGLSRKQFCAKDEEVVEYRNDHPLWGMPYALPGLAKNEHDVLTQWIEQGATYTARAPLPGAYVDKVRQWEAFLNNDSLKQQLASRYIYEHLSYAHLYFSEIDEPRFFSLVRSATPPGKPIEIIATRRPYDDPGVPRVYYRLQEYLSSTVVKSHMPYALNTERMQRWQALLIDADYQVTQLPPYDVKDASNPFRTFASMPVDARYKFMLDEAQFTIMAFIKGPVCRGEIAVDVIRDDFWVFFVDPDYANIQPLENFLATQAESLELPGEYDNIYRPLHRWHQFEKKQREFLGKKDQFLASQYDERKSAGLAAGANLQMVWDGNGSNDNAALTVYRHSDNASVQKGLLGQPPKTAWLIDYPLLERIHYLLVAGYDVYSNVGNQLDTRLYMDFLRMEGESNFLLMLPEAARIRERNDWYLGADEDVMSYLTDPLFESKMEPAIPYTTSDPKLELYEMLHARLQPVLPERHTLNEVANPYIRAQLERLEQLVGEPVFLLPEVAFVQITGDESIEWVTLVHNAAYSNITAMFREQKNRLPEDDTLSVVPGFIGSYPNAYYIVPQAEMAQFVDAVSSMQTEADYAALLDSYGIRRTNVNFWAHSDFVHESFQQMQPIDFGRFDYGRLENR